MSKSELVARIDQLTDSHWPFYEESTFGAAMTKTPDVPSGITITAMVDGILIVIDPAVDTSHSSVTNFQQYNVYARITGNADTEEKVGSIPFGMNSWTWQQDMGGYTGWDIALTGATNTGHESAKTDWARCVLSTFHDDFSDYGGSAISPLEHLSWLKLSNFETEAWYAGTNPGGGTAATADDTTNLIDGSKAQKLTATFDTNDREFYQYAQINGAPYDLSVDGRFTADDYICIAAYIYNQPITQIALKLYSGGGAYYYAILDSNVVTTGWKYYKVKRSDFLTVGSPAWTAISYIEMYLKRQMGAGTSVQSVTFDDWRIVKASPSDATTFNDTGDTWKPTDGTWHVYPGNRTGEPSLAFTLGQIETPANDWFFAYPQNVNVVNGRASAMVYLKGTDGRAGPLFRVEDDTAGTEDSMAVIVDTTADLIYLVQWEAGGDAATTNMVLNPGAEAAGNFGNVGSATATADTTYAYRGIKAYKVVTTAAANDGISLTLSALTNADHTVSYWVYDGVPTDFTYDPFPTAQVSLDNTNWHVPTVLETKEGWVRYAFTVDDAEANGSTTLYIRQSDATARTLYIDGVQVEAAAAATAYCDGAQGLGYSWSGTAHQSTSSRQAGSPITHASATYTSAVNTDYWVGVDFRDPNHERRVNVYAGTSQASLFTAAALVISSTTTRPWPAGGGVGVATYGANSRFGDFRAGSPQTADYAHQAGNAKLFDGAALSTSSALGTSDALVPTQHAVKDYVDAQAPIRATFWPGESLVTVGSAIARAHDASQDFATYCYQNPGADGDTFTQSFVLLAGTYTFNALGATNNNQGKIDWYVDNVKVISAQDWYSAALAYNVIKSTGSISVTGNGRHVLKGVVNGKNGSSSGYNIALTKMWLTPASDS